MCIYVTCSECERNDIAALVRERFGAEDFVLIPVINLSYEPDDIIVIGHETVSALKRIKLSTWENVFLFFKGVIVSLAEESELTQRRDAAIRNEDWNLAKSINDILIDFDFLKGNAVSAAMPDYLQIETTSICNAKCIMCSHYFSENKNGKFLSDETLGCMMDAIQLSRTISLNGMGEPFISPSLEDKIDLYARLGNKIVSNTNLSILNERLLSQINQHFEWLEVSCDGATKETYEAIRQGLSFDTFMANLMLLKERCPNVRIHIATVVMRQNVHEMPQMVELASEAGANIITFMTLNSNIIINNQQDEMCNYPRVLEYYSAAALSRGEELGIPVIVPNMGAINRDISFEEIQGELSAMKRIPRFKDARAIQQMKDTAAIVDQYLETHDEIQRDTTPSTVRCSGICDWLLKRSYVDLEGNVAMCCRNQSFHAGNVNDTGNFGAVWNSRLNVKLRDIFYSGYLPEACLKCGLIESGNLEYLDVEIDGAFYKDAAYKSRQKQTLKKLLEV